MIFYSSTVPPFTAADTWWCATLQERRRGRPSRQRLRAVCVLTSAAHCPLFSLPQMKQARRGSYASNPGRAGGMVGCAPPAGSTVLCVAEKPSVAKAIAEILSQGKAVNVRIPTGFFEFMQCY